MNDYPMDSTAAGFMETLKKMGDDLKADMETIVNNVVEKTFDSMMAPSPVDKGNYVASHRIANGSPRTDYFSGDFGGPRQSEERKQKGVDYSKQEAADFRWSLADSSVWFSNYVFPHAEYVEVGGPTWKRPGYFIYTHAEQRMKNIYIPEEVKKAGY